jgi:hypothetical protein
MEVITSYLAVLRDPSVPSNRVARAPPGGPGANDDRVKMLRHAPPCLNRTLAKTLMWEHVGSEAVRSS